MSESGPRTEKRKIGERYYAVTQLPPSRAMPLQLRLSNIILPLLPAFAVMESKGAEQAVSQAISALGNTLAEVMPPDELYELARSLIEDGTYVMAGDQPTQLSPVIFEQEFMGDKLANIYLLLGFILEVNYARFFSVLGLDKLTAMAQSRLTPMQSGE
jgi:hypothetical protein